MTNALASRRTIRSDSPTEARIPDPEIANPWEALPEHAPYVLENDAPLIIRFNARAASDKRYDLSLLPEPFFGSRAAPVVLLALNPGWSPNDAIIHGSSAFVDQARRSLRHELSPYPFLHLQPRALGPGSLWWRRITAPLIAEAGFEAVARNILCVQYFPYHSIAFGSPKLIVPSQHYGFELARAAMRRGAEVVVLRSRSLWAFAVPELSGYSRLHLVRNPRNPTLSPGNLTSGFESVLTRIERGA